MARENETAPAFVREQAVVFGPKESHCIKRAVPYFEKVESHTLRMLVQGTRKYFAFSVLSPVSDLSCISLVVHSISNHQAKRHFEPSCSELANSFTADTRPYGGLKLEISLPNLL